MATKKCPNCNSDCPVASSSCKKCLHVFKSRKGSSNSFSSPNHTAHPLSTQNSTDDTISGGGGGSSESQGRRHTGRITRSKPNFYDSLHVEEQMRQDSKLITNSDGSQETITKVFVTVGTTSFEELVNRIQTEDMLDAFLSVGVKEVQVQMGDSATSEGYRTLRHVKFEFFRYKTDIKREIESSDLVVSHAGAGTVLDVLSQHKRLIVVPNDALMDNHQHELADYLAAKRHAFRSTIKSLPQTLSSIMLDTPRVPLPASDPQAFDRYLKLQLRLSEVDVRMLESGKIDITLSRKGGISYGRLTFMTIVLILCVMQKLLLRKQMKQSRSEDDCSGGVDDCTASTREKESCKSGEPETKKRKRGRPPGLTGKKPTSAGRITIHSKNSSSVKLAHNHHVKEEMEDPKDNESMKDEDIMADITPEKALQYNIVLDEINRKWISASWKVS